METPFTENPSPPKSQSLNNLLNIPPWHDEDYEEDWGFLDVKGKVILDIGADYGSTAAFFLNKGAVKVICVECYDNDYDALAELATKEPRIEAFNKRIASSTDIELFITTYQPEVVKIDAEGGEAHLLGVRPCVLRRVQQYGIELHNLANSEQCGNPRPPAYEGINDLQSLFERLFSTKVRGYTLEPLYKGKWVLNVRKVGVKRRREYE